MEQVQAACKQAEIHDYIMTLENGYESVVGENGVVLSGGQRQRLAIARALLRNSNIILLDEATSSLDNDSQDKIKQTIYNLSKNHTIIIVAHRLSTIVNCDSIIVMEDHKIVAQGKHKELLKTCKPYIELYNTTEE